MSARYTFCGDQTLVSSNSLGASVVWNEDNHHQNTINLNYTDGNDGTLTDSINESYVTAVGDNSTQYLSVLESSNDITLECLHNLSLGNPKMEPVESELIQEQPVEVEEDLITNSIEMEGQQVVVYSLEGSDDLFGIQLAQDEEGNIQKYQFKFRTNEDGQLEAIPESLELLQNDDDEGEVETQTEEVSPYVENVQEELIDCKPSKNNLTIFVEQDNSSEHILPDDPTFDSEMRTEEIDNCEEISQQDEDDEVVENDMNHEEQTIEYEEVDIKTGLMEAPCDENNGNCIKSEMMVDEESQQSQLFHGMYNREDHEVVQDYESLDAVEEHEENEGTTTIVEYHEGEYEEHELDTENVENIYVTTENDVEDVKQVFPERNYVKLKSHHYEEIFVQENHIVPQNSEEEVTVELNTLEEVANENESDNEDYQTVEGLHITADIEEGDEHTTTITFNEPETILEEVLEKPPAPVIPEKPKQVKLLKEYKTANGDKTYFYYVLSQPEKENVNSLQTTTINTTTTTTAAAVFKPEQKVNPRSILKSSYTLAPSSENVKGVDSNYNRRFSRNKEAIQARQFHNFISRTTIIEAPIRQQRLPRKQTIKPVDERVDEEIIVQEVMVSSTGFVQDLKRGASYNASYVELIELTDSDDDYNPKRSGRKRERHSRKARPPSKIDTITCTSESEGSVIEINSEDEDGEVAAEVKSCSSVKRGRGRPRKTAESIKPEVIVTPLKRRRGRPPKSSSQTSDTNEESASKKSRTDDEEECSKKEFDCPHCPKTFPSENSLNTHIQHHNLENSLRNNQKVVQPKSSSTFEYKHKCAVCEMTFKNAILLGRHVCQNKVICGICKKSFSDGTQLNVHKRVHVKEQLIKSTCSVKISPKKFIPRPSISINAAAQHKEAGAFKCSVCSKLCSSMMNLNVHSKTHKRFTCFTCTSSFPSKLLLDMHVRENCVKSRSPARRLSLKIRKSCLPLSYRTSTTKTPAVASTSTVVTVKCEFCTMTFSNYSNLFKHKVSKHGVETPDRTILKPKPKRNVNPKPTHLGLPTNHRLRTVQASLKQCLMDSSHVS